MLTSTPMAYIRAATAADLPSILAIYNHAILHTTAAYDHAPVTLQNRTEWFEQRTAAGFPVVVAEVNGKVAGWGSYGPFRPRLGYSRSVEHSVYLAPEMQGQGLGGQLLEALIAHARQAGFHSMIGVIDADNAGSIRFHKRYGFREVGRLPEVGHKFGRWLDVVLFARRLNDNAAPQHGEH